MQKTTKLGDASWTVGCGLPINLSLLSLNKRSFMLGGFVGDVKSRVRTQPAQEAISKNKKDLCEGGEENKRERERKTTCSHVLP